MTTGETEEKKELLVQALLANSCVTAGLTVLSFEQTKIVFVRVAHMEHDFMT